MLVESGDLIPVKKAAADIPWTKRKAVIFSQNFLHRGPVDFSTYVYDTNVGDIAPISTYFNPYHWTVDDLNNKFGIKRGTGSESAPTQMLTSPSPTMTDAADAKCRSLQPKLFIYPLEEGSEVRSRCNAGVVNFHSGMANQMTLGSIFRPRAIRPSASGIGSNNSPTSPDSPDRQDWLQLQMNDSSPRGFSISPSGSLEPIGPPKRRKITSKGSMATEAEAIWPKINLMRAVEAETKSGAEIQNSYFSILSEDSPWSPWRCSSLMPTLVEPKEFEEPVGIEDDLAASLRQLVQQTNVFFA